MNSRTSWRTALQAGLCLLVGSVLPAVADEPAPDPPTAAAAAASPAAAAAPGPVGCLLYAHDDDWDWASPKAARADRRSKLSTYGTMPWSAMDALERDLPEVRGLVVGSLPVKHLTLDELNAVRTAGKARPYRHVDFEPGKVAAALAGDDKPNVIVIVDYRPPKQRLNTDDITALSGFVRAGGRAMVLDDWGVHRGAFEAVVEQLKPPPPAVELSPDEARRVQRERAERVRQLVLKLSHDQWAVREQATKDLIQIGEKVIPLLRAVEPQDAEAGARIQRVLTTLDPQRKPSGREYSNEDLQAMQATLRQSFADVQVRTIYRNAGGGEGRAILLRLPTGPASPAAAGDESE